MNHFKLTQISLGIIALASLNLVGCSSSGSNSGGSGANAPKPIAVLNDTAPTAGDFIKNSNKKTTVVVNQEDTSTVILAVKDNEIKQEAEVKQDNRKREIVTGVHSIHYDENGKLHGFTALTKGAFVKSDSRTQEDANKYNKLFSENLVKNSIVNYTDQATAAAGQTYDAGLQEGGQYAGVYARENQVGAGYIWRDPAVAGWNYQTFGNFKEDENFNIKIGYQSFGSNTTKEQLPTKGTATYNGISTGHIFYEGAPFDGHGDQTTADVEVKADFGKRSLDFATTNTKRHTLQVVDGKVNFKSAAADEFNLKGTATWNVDSAKFAGTDLKAGDAAKLETGNLQGSFYGDKAAEVGGVFSLQSTDKKTSFVGGYGAKRK